MSLFISKREYHRVIVTHKSIAVVKYIYKVKVIVRKLFESTILNMSVQFT